MLSITPPGWSNLEQTTNIHRFFEIGGIAVLGILVLFEAVAYIYGHRKETLTELAHQAEESAATAAREAEQKRANAEIAELHSHTQGLQKRTKHLDSRVLSPDEVLTLRSAAKSFRGQTFWIITQTNDYSKFSEQMEFSDQLRTILKSEGWVEGGYTGQMYRRITEAGIEIASGAGTEAQKAANALRETIAGFSITTRPPVVYNDIALTTVLIDIGLR